MFDRPDGVLNQVAGVLDVAACKAVGVLDDQGDIAAGLLTERHRPRQAVATVAVVGAEGLVGELADDLPALGPGPLPALL